MLNHWCDLLCGTRDIKPDNILINDKNDAIVADLGTTRHFVPELELEDDGNNDNRADKRPRSQSCCKRVQDHNVCTGSGMVMEDLSPSTQSAAPKSAMSSLLSRLITSSAKPQPLDYDDERASFVSTMTRNTGTPQFMAPELEGEEYSYPVDVASHTLNVRKKC